MLKSAKIENFRGFKNFELQQLGRINLLVGTNNSGKTSLLEAIQLLCSRTNLEPLIKTMGNRGEYSLGDPNALGSRLRRDLSALDICNLFHGYEAKVDSKLVISGKQDGNDEELILSLEEASFDDVEGQFDDRGGLIDDPILKLVAQWKYGHQTDKVEERSFTLSSDLSLRTDYLRRIRADSSVPLINMQFVTPFSLPADRMIEMFEEQIVLTPEEDVINQALRNIEPEIERIAPISSRKARYTELGVRAGFLVKLSDKNQRVPIGSMGDGIWRMLGLTLSAVAAKGGVLFVDEIDTGLHFTALSNMWKLIWDVANRLNVQVFATTHSRDCWESLSEIARSQDAEEQGITIHRIEKNKQRSVVFNERRIVIAAEQDIEVR
ncbi:AAA family ATPase [Leptolyngbya sp. GGD]|uniref:AAA family ATPase n=1 Tax=Leptolyngbya sp. GGD TaxID=2997907 RepID=UPI00227C0D6F|nr:ATP-binding protein [Leptolyngbya sp. GGD]MCY6492380.1 AAA family ATPase [Leptolyngbya sp. GGD]